MFGDGSEKGGNDLSASPMSHSAETMGGGSNASATPFTTTSASGAASMVQRTSASVPPWKIKRDLNRQSKGATSPLKETIIMATSATNQKQIDLALQALSSLETTRGFLHKAMQKLLASGNIESLTALDAVITNNSKEITDTSNHLDALQRTGNIGAKAATQIAAAGNVRQLRSRLSADGQDVSSSVGITSSGGLPQNANSFGSNSQSTNGFGTIPRNHVQKSASALETENRCPNRSSQPRSTDQATKVAANAAATVSAAQATKVAANAAATASAAQVVGSKQVDGSKHLGCDESNKPSCPNRRTYTQSTDQASKPAAPAAGVTADQASKPAAPAAGVTAAQVSKAAASAAAVNTDQVDGSKHLGIYLICADATSSGNLVSDVHCSKTKDFSSLIWESTSKPRFKAHKGFLHDLIASEISAW